MAHDREPAILKAGREAGLSIVVPCFNEAPGLPAPARDADRDGARAQERARSCAASSSMSMTASSDNTFAVASALPASGVDVQVISLSRNFGKEAALLAGLEQARHGAVLFIDGDGQHPPDLIGKLVGHWLDDGYDVVYTAKAHRENESALHRLGVKTFYTLMNFRARHKIPEDAGDFRLLSPRAAAGLAAHAGAQPLLQRAGELDRLPAEARRLRAGRAHARQDQLELCFADRACRSRA